MCFSIQGLQGEIFVTQLFTNQLNEYGKAKRFFDNEGGSSLLGVQTELPLQIDDVAQTALLQSWQGCAVQA